MASSPSKIIYLPCFCGEQRPGAPRIETLRDHLLVVLQATQIILHHWSFCLWLGLGKHRARILAETAGTSRAPRSRAPLLLAAQGLHLHGTARSKSRILVCQVSPSKNFAPQTCQFHPSPSRDSIHLRLDAHHARGRAHTLDPCRAPTPRWSRKRLKVSRQARSLSL